MRSRPPRRSDMPPRRSDRRPPRNRRSRSAMASSVEGRRWPRLIGIVLMGGEQWRGRRRSRPTPQRLKATPGNNLSEHTRRVGASNLNTLATSANTRLQRTLTGRTRCCRARLQTDTRRGSVEASSQISPCSRRYTSVWRTVRFGLPEQNSVPQNRSGHEGWCRGARRNVSR